MKKFIVGLLISASLFGYAHAAGKNDGSKYIEQRCSAVKTHQLDGRVTNSNNVWTIKIYNNGNITLEEAMYVDKAVEGNTVSALYEVDIGFYQLILVFDDNDNIEYAIAPVNHALENIGGIEVGKCKDVGVFSVNQ